jgi:hypothetical protein
MAEASWLPTVPTFFRFPEAATHAQGFGRMFGGRDRQPRVDSGRRWAMYEHEMQNALDDPPDAWEETEFAFARLRFRSMRARGWYLPWGIDANQADRLFAQVLRRLTRVHVRSVEHIVDVDSDEMFNWPFLYAVSVGDWEIEESQALRLREYLRRGGFLMVDDFHAEAEWDAFYHVLRQILPEAQVVELPDEHPIFHTVYDLSKRVQIPGLNVARGEGYERGGVSPHWRAAVDEDGRVLVAMCFNMDVGDAWEWADHPDYPEEFATMAYKLGVNYVVYSMTH